MPSSPQRFGFRYKLRRLRPFTAKRGRWPTKSAGWGVESRNALVDVRSDVRASLPTSQQRATPHPTGSAGHLPQQEAGEGYARRVRSVHLLAQRLTN
jgi:hypothetical protein